MKARPIIFSAPMIRALLSGAKTQTRRVCKEQDLLTFLGNNSDEVGLRWVAPTNDAGKREHDQWCAYCEDYPEEGVIPLGVGYGQPGDLLYARESFWQSASAHPDVCGEIETRWCGQAEYGDERPTFRPSTGNTWGSRSSIHMPRWASRLTLQLTEVRVERVCEISEADAQSEGAFFTDYGRRCFHQGAPRDVGKCPAPDEHHPQREGWSMVPTESHEQCLHSARMAFANLWDSINAARGYGWSENPWVWCLSFRVIHANVDDVLASPERYLSATNRSETA